MAEDYIRPPVVAREAPSRQAAMWRFRAYVIIAVVAFVVAMFLIFKAITGTANDNPGINGQHTTTAHHLAGALRT